MIIRWHYCICTRNSIDGSSFLVYNKGTKKKELYVKMKKLIALTGSFNPVTIAHYKILSDAVERFDADEGIFIATDDKYLSRKALLKKNPPSNFILSEIMRGEMLRSLAETTPS